MCVLICEPGEIEEKDVGVDGQVPLEDLCRRAIDVSLHKNFTTNHAVSQASSYSNTLQSVYRQKEKIALVMQNAEVKNCCLTRLQILLTAHNWLHEDILQESFPPNVAVMSKINLYLNVELYFFAHSMISLSELCYEETFLYCHVNTTLKMPDFYDILLYFK